MQKLLRGRGCLARLPEMMEKLGMSRPLVVGRALVERLPEVGGAVFSAYAPNPDWAGCAAAADMYRREGCDGLISLGGGSAMDTAKGVKALLLSEDDAHALAGEFPSGGPRHIAIPATAGTGAEATQFAVVYVAGVKHSLSHPALLPDGAVLDAALLDTLPAYHRKACALDALCQGIESYWARAATEDSRVNAYLAILGVLDNLRPYLAGDPHAAEEMLEAAYRGGKAIQVSRTTAAHAMSYGLTKRLGIAHGHACALTLPFLWEQMVNNEDVLPTLMELADAMRLGSELMAPRLLCGILLDLGMTAPALPDPAILDELAGTVNVERLNNHPVPLDRDALLRIYRRAFTPLPPNEAQACLDIWRYYGRG